MAKNEWPGPRRAIFVGGGRQTAPPIACCRALAPGL